VRVVLVDDHDAFRRELRACLDDETDIDVVGEAADGLEAVRLAVELQPDAMIMDVGMPRLNGIEATRRISAACPAIRVLALSMHRERRFVEGMLAAGAVAYVLKENAAETLSPAIRTVVGGGTFVCPELG
jgi:DNA-binding NarL/FixJ family response regulator